MFERLTIVAVLLVTAALSASSALAATGPVGMWKLDEGSGTRVADSSGNGNNGVLSGGASRVPGVFGSSGLGFDGSGQVKVADNDVLEPPTSVTVSAWFRSDGTPGAYRYIVAKGANGCITASYGLYSGPNGGLEFYISQDHGTEYARSPDGGQGVWDGNWHLAVGTYDGSTIRLYVDGVQVASGTAWPGTLEYLLPDSNDFYIGNYPGCADHEFVGGIDDVMVWGRALSTSDIRALVSGGGLTTPSQPGQPSGTGSGFGTGSRSGTGTGPGTGTGTGGSNGGGTSTGGAATSAKGKTLPAVRGLKLSTSMVTVNAGGHLSGGSSRGLSLTYTASPSARLTVTLLRSQAGVRRASLCVKPPRNAHNSVHCARYVVVSSMVRTDRQGRLTLSLSRLLHRRLEPGTYQVNVTPRALGKIGKTVSLRFVVRRSNTPR